MLPYYVYLKETKNAIVCKLNDDVEDKYKIISVINYTKNNMYFIMFEIFLFKKIKK